MGKVELNIGIDPELVEQAKALGISIADMDERALRIHLQKVDPAGAEARSKRWAEENAEAIEDHNRRIRERGLLSDYIRPSWL
ncbi:type II toxin-antitoxin system CcdA family antitoxin [Brevundimonas sp. SL130]|uniref:type II toxin-antitoxin system CcdA family antitoxin n=1 Tax=Brevundimonas sp. SL130 TaxID=2995143 RepID=UPI00226C6E4A|nr:type II toxin-antitoxin system CcdA family antitoxin [Brevundimonas sp. SL130]WAC58431.1 type II toxin-antitoxin system CcdA family antitoxin [Brevundimonas sp. SL130]